MKRIIGLLTTMMLLVSLFSLPVLADVSERVVDTWIPSEDEANELVAELMAGKNTDVGEVNIEAIGANKYLVTYYVDEPDWYLTEVHFEAINAGDEAFIYSKGGLVPGKFTVKESFTLEDEVTKFSFEYTSGDDVLSFAAHAVVCQPAVYTTEEHHYSFVSDDLGTYYSTDGSIFTNLAVKAWVHPSWPSITDAFWVWESYQVDSPRIGETIFFKKDFSVLGEPTAAILEITADNEYYAMVNGQPTPAYFDNDWADKEYYDVLDLVDSGANTLLVEVRNWAWPTDSPTVNPGAVIFKLCVVSTEKCLVTPEVCESAWGYGVDADGSNWSQIIDNDVEYAGMTLVDTVVVGSDGQVDSSNITLASGNEYYLVASGKYKFANWAPPTDSGYADVKFNCREGSYIPDLTGYDEGEDYSINSDGTVWINGQAFGYALGLQLRINGDWAMWEGEYNSDHKYTKTLSGNNAKLDFAIYDNVYSDNSGFLTVQIYEIW